MKLIGVTGKPGSGKTTFSEHLEKRENVGVIHVDDILGNFKKKYFGAFLQSKEKNNTENTKHNPKLKSNFKELFFKNKFAFKLLMKLRSKLVEKELNSQIESFKRNGKKTVIIDDWNLMSHKSLNGKFNHMYIIDRNFVERRRGVQKRDNASLRELKIIDLPYALGIIKWPEGENVSKIENNGSIADLQNTADLEYEKFGELTFDERYSVKQNSINSLLHNMNKLPQVSSQSIDEPEVPQ